MYLHTQFSERTKILIRKPQRKRGKKFKLIIFVFSLNSIQLYNVNKNINHQIYSNSQAVFIHEHEASREKALKQVHEVDFMQPIVQIGWHELNLVLGVLSQDGRFFLVRIKAYEREEYR